MPDRHLPTLAVLGALVFAVPSLMAQEPENNETRTRIDLESLGIAQTQVTIALRNENRMSRFRATILAIEGRDLTLMSAAHCLDGEDVETKVHFGSGGEYPFEATIRSVVRNPNYQPNVVTLSPGNDNEVVRLEVAKESAADERFADLRPATLSEWPIPERAGQTIGLLTIDQTQHTHVLVASNHSSPLWLEWGPRFKPLPGDSGSGVFVLKRGEDGKPQPLLIGTVIVRGPVGGGASLVWGKAPWVARSLPEDPAEGEDANPDEPPPPPTAAPETSPGERP